MADELPDPPFAGPSFDADQAINALIDKLRQDPRKPKRIVVAMSGGVDSSVTAWLLKEAGIETLGVTLRLRSCASRSEDAPSAEIAKACCGAEDSIHAQTTAGRIGIPHYFLDYQEEFRQKVLVPSWEEYARGRTPNPCVLCNQHLKFGKLKEYALRMGADGIATGHYARVEPIGEGRLGLFRGMDPQKDQSYFLFALGPETLPYCWFPLGWLTKKQVRQIAKKLGFTNADKRESQDACFIVQGEPFADTLRRTLNQPVKGGFFVTEEGRVLGPHRGIHCYTLGQRRGLGVALGSRAYVCRIDPSSGRVYLSTDEKALESDTLEASGVQWLDPSYESGPFRALVQVRYTQKPTLAMVYPQGDGRISIRFDAKIRAITPGQAAVAYRDDQVVCGGWIQ